VFYSQSKRLAVLAWSLHGDAAIVPEDRQAVHHVSLFPVIPFYVTYAAVSSNMGRILTLLTSSMAVLTATGALLVLRHI
jgi:hypothetical protein